MNMPRARFIPELLDIHAEEIEFLWGQRRNAMTSPYHTPREIAGLNERIEAHVQGLLAVPAALPQYLLQRLESDERDVVFAAAYPLLRLDEPSIAMRIAELFATSEGARLDGLRDALGIILPAVCSQPVLDQYLKAEPARAVAAAVVLAQRRQLDAQATRLNFLLQDPDPAVAGLAWGIVASVDQPS
ncbi:MAG: hypothetical protein HGA75_09440, partial [Thiobacillus sp.]|nr:hypothetical protein [Thiobacillus sp.]